MNSEQDNKAIEILGGHEAVRAAVDSGEITEEQYEALYPIYEEDMPYGTAKARTGDPYEFIYERICELEKRLVPEEETISVPDGFVKAVKEFSDAATELQESFSKLPGSIPKKKGLPLTSERIRQYHEDQTCLNPDCDGDANDGLEWDSAEFQGDECYQKVTCTKCGWKWDDRYAFEGVVDVRDDDNNGIQDWAGTKWEEIINSLTSQTEILPTLMGIHPDLDELIEQKLKEM